MPILIIIRNSDYAAKALEYAVRDSGVPLGQILQEIRGAQTAAGIIL